MPDMSKRQMWNRFRAARWNEQEMYARAEAHRTAHGSYPAEFAAAQAATVRAFEQYEMCPVISGMWLEG
jgi:hypothetical protein